MANEREKHEEWTGERGGVLEIFMTLRKSWVKTVIETVQYEHSSSPKCLN